MVPGHGFKHSPVHAVPTPRLTAIVCTDESAAALLEFKNGHKVKQEPAEVEKRRTSNVIEEVIEDMEEDDDDDMSEIDDRMGQDEEEDDDEAIPTLGPAALGLQRVGSKPKPKKAQPTPPAQVLNARGMPVRIRKKNRLFYDDDIVNTPHHRVSSAKKMKTTPATPSKRGSARGSGSVKKEPKYTPKKAIPHKSLVALTNAQSPDRKIGQKIGLRLRNLLKLPKAHKWVCYEWFYSNIDRCLFEGENDFSICLKESFPDLKTRQLSRIEWTKVRRMMGKPRRCSQAFFTEERLELEKKRKKIRALQQRKATDMSNFKDLPPEVPMQLVIGTKVTARLRKPQDGLFTGRIDAVDTSNNTYRITFERQSLGTHSVPDYEVLSDELLETISTSSFGNKFRPRSGRSPSKATHVYSNVRLRNDPLLSESMVAKTAATAGEGKIGGFPARLLEKMVLVTKILSVKRRKVNELKALNAEAEASISFNQQHSEQFEQKYAGVLLDLEKLNDDLQNYLEQVQSLCHEIALEPSVAAMLAPSHLRERCRQEAVEVVDRHAAADSGSAPPAHPQIMDLITDLTALMLQVKCLADSDQNAYELEVLQGTIERIKIKLSPANRQVFQRCVEVHVRHIEVGLSHGNEKMLMSST